MKNKAPIRKKGWFVMLLLSRRGGRLNSKNRAPVRQKGWFVMLLLSRGRGRLKSKNRTPVWKNGWFVMLLLSRGGGRRIPQVASTEVVFLSYPWRARNHVAALF